MSTNTSLEAPLVDMRKIRVSFGGVVAVDDVNVELRAGEVVGLVGGNGAGKSTLMRTLSGAHPPDSGEILMDGHPVVIAGRNVQKLERTASELRDAGAKASFITGDASDPEDANRFVAEAERLAPLAVAVHNAGSNEPAPFLQVSEERFMRHWREHALGGFQLAQHAIPSMALLLWSIASVKPTVHPVPP